MGDNGLCIGTLLGICTTNSQFRRRKALETTGTVAGMHQCSASSRKFRFSGSIMEHQEEEWHQCWPSMADRNIKFAELFLLGVKALILQDVKLHRLQRRLLPYPS